MLYFFDQVSLLTHDSPLHNFTKVVDERLDYQVNCVQFRYSWDWGTCPLYGIWGFPHFRGFDYTKTYVNAFRTKLSVCSLVDGCFSGVSVRQGSTVYQIYNIIPSQYLSFLT